MHSDFTGIGIQITVIILAALWNRNDIKSLRSEMKDELGELKQGLREEMKAGFQHLENRLLVIEGDIRSFHSKIGNLDGRLEAVERQQQRK